MIFSSTVELYQDGRTNIRKKLPEDTLTNASIDIVLLMLVLILFLANHQLSLGNYRGDNLIHSMLITPFYKFFYLRVTKNIVVARSWPYTW